MWLCQFFCCGGKVNFVQILYSHDHSSKISRTFFVKKMIPYKLYVQEDQLFLALYGSTTIQSLLFLKNIKNFFWFPKQYLLGFFILEKQLANIWDRGCSCFSVTLFYSTLFCCGGKANFERFTLFYFTLLTLTDGQKDRQRNEYTPFAWAGGTCPHFAWAGGTCPRFAWAEGTFFPVVLLCQFLVLAGNRFWLYILLCTWSTIQLWCCVSFFGSGK